MADPNDPHPRLTIAREGTRVVLRVRLDVVNETFEWSYDARTEWAATLLRNALSDALSKRMSQAREEAYEDGWKHAKAKKAKETWFSMRLP
jgi:hypothetical protein